MPRRAAKIDLAQPAIVQALREAGYTVAITSQLGDGYPDIHVANKYSSILLEIKTLPTSGDWSAQPIIGLRRRALLTELELGFHERWPRPIPIVFDADEALLAVSTWL